MVMGMASHIKMGESLLIPFRNGQSISDSQLKPRMYKTMQAFEKSFPGHYLGTDGVELVEYVPAVRCKDCVNYCGFEHCKNGICDVDSVSKRAVYPNDFCSYGERRTDDRETG